MMYFIALLSLAAAVRADPPHACCAPSPYTGVLLTIGGANPAGTDKVTFTDQRLKIEYDYVMKFIRLSAETRDQKTGVMVTSEVWDDYQNGMRYIVANDNNCYKQTIDPNSMQPPCIKGNLTYVGNTLVGYGPHGVPVHMWSGSDAQGRLSVSVTSDGECTPVTMTRYGDNGSERSLHAYLFTDIQKSVQRTDFTIPRKCATAQTIPSGKRDLHAVTGVWHPFTEI